MSCRPEPRFGARTFKILAACVLAGGIDNAQACAAQAVPAAAASGPSSGIVVIAKFAAASAVVAGSDAIEDAACPKSPGADMGAASSSPMDPKITTVIDDTLGHDLSTKLSVLTWTGADSVPQGAFLIVGCITRADPGNAAARTVGFGLGASHLQARVQLLSATPSGWALVKAFDVQTDGANTLPPLGPIGIAIHAASYSRETLSGDAKRLAEQVSRKVLDTMAGDATANTAKADTSQGPP